MDTDRQTNYQVRMLNRNEWATAINLAWRIFLQFEAPEYSEKGIRSFRDFIEDPRLKRMFIKGQYLAFGAFDGDKLVGMAGVRNESHISLLFVDEKYHKKGIGNALLQYVFEYVGAFGINRFTVNAAPYATGFYHKVGFLDDDKEVVADGIRFTPMHLVRNQGV